MQRLREGKVCSSQLAVCSKNMEELLSMVYFFLLLQTEDCLLQTMSFCRLQTILSGNQQAILARDLAQQWEQIF